MILSVSRRTDIPAFFSDWFYNRVKSGYVYVRNPFNIHQVSKIIINPEVVDCIVFWTKNPKYFNKSLNILDKYCYYFQYTITGYGNKLEPNVPDLQNSINCFIDLSKKIGSKRIIWRYDPIIITDEININYHINHFENIAKLLSTYTKKCVISFVDFYKKSINNLAQIKYYELSKSQIIFLVYKLKEICDKYCITLVSCAEEIDLTNQGVLPGKCIDDKLIKEVFGFSMNVQKDKNQRAECGCIASVDIGAYNSCLHGCLYCYANYNMIRVKENYYLHNPKSDILFGEILPNDKITNKKVVSCKIIQKSLFNI
jgi:hypothetical protein